MAEDPFFEVAEDVKEALSVVKPLFGQWEDAVAKENTSSKEFDNLTETIKEKLFDIADDCAALQETIDIVTRSNKFELPAGEVRNRKEFIATVVKTVDTMEKKIDSTIARIKNAREQRENLFALPKSDSKTPLTSPSAPQTRGNGWGSRAPSRAEKLGRMVEEENDEFIANERQRQQQLRRQEDEHLEEMSHDLDILSEMSISIGETLEEHDSLLDQFQSDIQRTTNRITGSIKKVSEMIDKSSNTTSW
eukprot:CAMPEP_0174250214 /NCGR_PEP_ID=MMETSP0439-20130205/458_1 /TAXON_ID=0 /ORGANISM="Stereomyxa ramosa, Strain Chinc5" /LENGTH=248 /DNA_ID=CAMNT_0015330223 /DNA_START=28 /DNA_END=771 /DNA_ORIENTATION=+